MLSFFTVWYHTHKLFLLLGEKKTTKLSSLHLCPSHTGNLKIHTHTHAQREFYRAVVVCLFCSPHPRLSIVLTPWLWKEEVPPALLGSLLQLQHTHLCTCSDGVYEGGFLFWFVPSVLPPPSSPLGFSRILFWNWRRKRKSKKKKKKGCQKVRRGSRDGIIIIAPYVPKPGTLPASSGTPVSLQSSLCSPPSSPPPLLLRDHTSQQEGYPDQDTPFSPLSLIPPHFACQDFGYLTFCLTFS